MKTTYFVWNFTCEQQKQTKQKNHVRKDLGMWSDSVGSGTQHCGRKPRLLAVSLQALSTHISAGLLFPNSVLMSSINLW